MSHVAADRDHAAIPSEPERRVGHGHIGAINEQVVDLTAFGDPRRGGLLEQRVDLGARVGRDGFDPGAPDPLGGRIELSLGTDCCHLTDDAGAVHHEGKIPRYGEQ